MKAWLVEFASGVVHYLGWLALLAVISTVVLLGQVSVSAFRYVGF